MADSYTPDSSLVELVRAAARSAVHYEEYEGWFPNDPSVDVPDACADAVLAALAEAGRLLPPDAETRIEWGTRVTWDDGAIDDVRCESREFAQHRVNFHAHRREETPGWRATAELITRPHWVGPWQPVPTGPETESE